MTSIKDTVERWRNKDINGTTLMRQIVTYDQWQLPVADEAVGEMLAGESTRLMYQRTSDGAAHLYLFSSAEAFEQYRAAVGDGAAAPQHFLSVGGQWVFRLPLTEIDDVVIDPVCEWQISYSRDQFGRLRQMVAALEVEAAIEQLRFNPSPPKGMMWLVKNYPSFLVAVTQVDGQTRLIFAPDGQGRQLAALFTFDDAFAAYQVEMQPRYPDFELRPLRLPGQDLFSRLAQLDIDGLVFNCSGPAQTIAFTHEFAARILAADLPH